MADTVEMHIPKDAAVRVMCQDLHKMREGLAAMGLHAHILDQVSDKLKEQAREIERFKSDRCYVLGHNDGWHAAMSTGLTGESEYEQKVSIDYTNKPAKAETAIPSYSHAKRDPLPQAPKCVGCGGKGCQTCDWFGIQ